jgi:hypothetical protein
MTICIGEVMVMQQYQELCADMATGAIASVDQLVNAPSVRPRYEQTDPGPEEWQDRLRTLQQWVCELLIKNQQLRMSLELARAMENTGQDKRNL